MSRAERLGHQSISNRQYFVSQFQNRLEELHRKLTEIEQKSLTPAIIQGLLLVGIGLLAGKMAKALPGAPQNETLTIGGGLLGAWAAYTGIQKVEELKAFSSIALMIFDKLQIQDEEAATTAPLISLLYEEFRLSIEMLSADISGIDRLILYFVLSILGSAARITDQMPPDRILHLVLENIRRPPAGFFAEQKRTIFEKEENTSLPLDLTTITVPDEKNGWRLDELILHSPAFLVTADSQGGSGGTLYKFSVHLLPPTTIKYRLNAFYIPCEVKAEASHKYPARFIQSSQSSYLLLPPHSFTFRPEYLPVANCLSINTELKIDKTKSIAYAIKLSSLYWTFSENRRKNYPGTLLKNAVIKFNDLCQNLFDLRIRLHENSLYYLEDIQNMKNLYWQELHPREGAITRIDKGISLALQQNFRRLNESQEITSNRQPSSSQSPLLSHGTAPTQQPTLSPASGINLRVTESDLEGIEQKKAEELEKRAARKRQVAELERSMNDFSTESLQDKIYKYHCSFTHQIHRGHARQRQIESVASTQLIP